MAFFGKLFAARGGDAYHNGVALFEQGRYAEAIQHLKTVFEQDPASPRGSIAGLHLRQSLAAEARRLLQEGRNEAAADLFGEAVGYWPDFPDLQFQAGAVHAMAGRWDFALDAARTALRRNPDYCEARLLEACALQGMDRTREARASLLALLESGRRVDHALLRTLQGELDLTAEDSCPELMGHVRRAVLGDDVKRRLAEAVALCRAGCWPDGLERLRGLGEQFPHYPDIRARHAAALYQTGEIADALREAEAALRCNQRYRTAVNLKGLILAEQGALQQAHDFLKESVPHLEGATGRHEELFLAYIRAVLALLLGDLDDCHGHLEDWHDLPRQFARAALLLVACDDLAGLPDSALRRLEELVRIWPGDAELQFLRAALLLRQKQTVAAESVLAQWSGNSKVLEDTRPLLLRSRLNLLQGREPILPPDRPCDDSFEADSEPPLVHEAAWRQLAVAAHLLRGEADQAWRLAMVQLESGMADEETGRLYLQAAARAGAKPDDDLAARIGPADSWVFDLCRLLRRQHDGGQAEQLIRRRAAVRPDLVQWSWLSAGFWLDPVRRWLE